MTTRKEILEQLAAGEIDVTQATEWLNGLSSGNSALPEPAPEPAPVPVPAAQPAPQPKGKRRWLRVHITDLDTGRARVRVNVPLALVNLGLKLGSRFTDEMNEDMIHDLLEAVQDESITGTLVEVEDLEDNERVVVMVD